MTYSFLVRTQHETAGRFIVPIPVDAATPLDAARQRFEMLGEGSRSETTALLVTNYPDAAYGGNAHVFVVREVVTTSYEVSE